MKNVNRVIRFLSLAVIASAAPLAMTNAQGPQVNKACAATLEGTCCPAASVCMSDGSGGTVAGYEYHEGLCI